MRTPRRPLPRHTAAAALALASLASLASPAAAQDARATAQALFDDAVAEMHDKAYDRACPKLEAVVKLQPGKVGAMLVLAQCYEDAGKLATAWSRYRAAADEAAPKDARGPKARARADDLAKRIPRLTLTVAAANRATPGFTLTRGGHEVVAAEWDAALPVDPGSYPIVASAPGKKRWAGTVTVGAGQPPVTLDVPALADDAPSAAPVAAAPAPVSGDAAPAPEPAAAGPSKVVVIAGGAVAGAALIAGGVFLGLRASEGSTASTRRAAVPSAGCPLVPPASGPCADLASALHAQATFGNAAIGTFVAAGVIGAGTIAYFLMRRPRNPPSAIVVAPVLGAGTGGVAVAGTF